MAIPGNQAARATLWDPGQPGFSDFRKICLHRDRDAIAPVCFCAGEEFAMILPDTELIGAAKIAEAARQAVERLNIRHAFSLTAPFVRIRGIVAVVMAEAEMSAQQLIAAAVTEPLSRPNKSGVTDTLDAGGACLRRSKRRVHPGFAAFVAWRRASESDEDVWRGHTPT